MFISAKYNLYIDNLISALLVRWDWLLVFPVQISFIFLLKFHKKVRTYIVTVFIGKYLCEFVWCAPYLYVPYKIPLQFGVFLWTLWWNASNIMFYTISTTTVNVEKKLWIHISTTHNSPCDKLWQNVFKMLWYRHLSP